MDKTINQLLGDMKEGKKIRVKKFKDLIRSMLFDLQDHDYEKIKPGTSYYNGKPSYYKNGAPMTYCNVFCYLFSARFGKDISPLLGINPRSKKPSPFYTPINYFLKNCVNQDTCKRISQEINFKEAQNFAKFGGLVFVIAEEKFDSVGDLIDPGHMALVYPQDEIEENESDIMIAGAGSAAVWGLRTNYDAFLKYGYNPRYFLILDN
jgi:hypothetical protein